MTLWQLAAATRRGWPGALLGAAATAVLLWFTSAAAPVYSAEATVVVVSDAVPSDLRRPQNGLVLIASLVSQRVADRLPARTTSDTVTLVGSGVRRGYLVTTASSGNQWQRQTQRPELRVQAVGASESEVRTTLATAMRRIEEELAALQAPLDVPDRELVRAEIARPASVVPVRVGSRARQGAAALLLGAVLGTAALLLVDRFRAPRTSPRHGSEVSAQLRPATRLNVADPH